MTNLDRTESASFKSLRYIYVVITALISHVFYAQQIQIVDNLSPSQLIEEHLAIGCVEVSDITSSINGSVNQINSYGYFERGSSNFPFENGIVLTTGSAISAGNTQNTITLNEGDTNWGTDSDLENALGITNTLNATSIEFNFTSVTNQIQFNYILASEEYYANFPCDYSDGFAFLIKEAGSTMPYTNIAIIPGTNTSVNTNTIHEEIVGICPAQNEAYFEGYNIGDTNFNGRTTVMTATANIEPYVEYHIKLIVADQSDESYDSAVFIEGNSFNSSVDLGSDISTCANNTTLNAEIDNNNASYEWYFNNGVINGETTPSLNVTESGEYRVLIRIPLNNDFCEIEDSVQVNLNDAQTLSGITNFSLCDTAENDGIRVFNLDTKTPEILALLAPSNYSISYHLSENDAITNNNSLSSLIQNSNNPQTLFVRIEDIDNGCLTYAQFDLIVNPSPEIIEPEPLIICDPDAANGATQVDLTQLNDEVSNNNPDVLITYHYSQTDANTGDNPINSIFVNTNSNQNVFIRVTNPDTGCSDTTSVSITLLETPQINSDPQTINACEDDDDGFETFDLSTVINDILQGLTNVTVTFHTTNQDAQTGDNPIQDITNYENTTPNVQVVYVRVVSADNDCPAISTVTLYSNILESETNIRNFYRCDDASNDGISNFNLTNIANTIINGLPNTTVTFYENEQDQLNETNAIDQNTPYQVTSSPHTLYITISNDDCTHLSSINLIINPPVIIQPLSPVDYCDTDDDGFTSIDLSTFDTYFGEGITDPQVSYYLTQQNADDLEGALPPFYTNISNPQTLYISVRNGSTGCRDTAEIQINVIPAPTVIQPSDIIICDDNQDGFYIVNLDDKISEMISDTTNLNISFFTSLNDANSNIDAIENTDTYNANTQTIYSRIESDITSCYAVAVFDIIINTEPYFPEISNYSNCESDGNQTAEFVFINKDEEILDGQTGKRVLYFTEENHAINRTNIIDKTVAYTNTSNPQTIYVRTENISDVSCYNTASFSIDVGSNPIYNTPLDQAVCDDISNDGQEIFDLSIVTNQISLNSPENLTITYHRTLNEANNAQNSLPLDFANEENPQQIYARIDNGTHCFGIAEFGLQVIQVPIVNSAPEIVLCDDDYDEITTFDLTVSESEVLNIRQDDIAISYHADLNDVENHIEIQNPNAYNNTSNPQTVYIKITNTISLCYVSVPIDLHVNIPPQILAPLVQVCEPDNLTYNLSDALPTLIGNQQNIETTFYANLTNAENESNALDTNYTYTSYNDTIYVRAENTLTNCVQISSFNLIINPTPVAHSAPNLETCDDDFDAMHLFDLSDQTPIILGNQSANQYTVSYFELEEEAIDNANTIQDLNYVAYDNQTLYARIENNTTNCFSITSFDIFVHRKPELNIPDQTVCLNNLPLVVSADTGFASDSYQWSTNATTPTIDITQVGTYSVTVTTPYGCSTSTTFNVIESEQATIEFTETVDFSDPNNITVTISGIGDYVYILDGGAPQESNIFYNVTLGPHTIEVYDLNGCASAIKEIVVVDAPLFFTPNNDGQNDVWQITGIEKLEGTIVYIFDRYGKLLKTLSHTSIGWDGTYNNSPMPTSDYWFLAKVKKDESEFEVKGHFTLKR
ncbi:choice-of-anchor L domain-containing protein [Corallibacter sp.]|uniref:choice-of-anchor L domain-containing protein n=1 Tax=Corallibacter sp. TaxID=2038084 RepID=UPI003AB26F8B